MAANGSKVGVREFYKELGAVESRLASKIDSVLEAVYENRTVTATTLATLGRADEDVCRRVERIDGKGGTIEGLHAQVDDLKASDKRWGGATAIVAVIGSVVAAILGRS
jgi:hypothetical protein